MSRLLAIAVLIGLFAPAAWARQRAFGYCEDGGQAVVTNSIYSNGTVSLLGGNVNLGTGVQASYPACNITVYIGGTLTPAVVYSDNSGTALTNPFPAANDGYWYFYADDGKYDVRFSGAGIPSPFTRPDYLLCDGCTGGGGGGGLSVVLTPTGNQIIVQPAGTFLRVNRLEGFRFADQFASIAGAATDAGANGAVIVPPDYPGVDVYSAPLSAPIWDARRNSTFYSGNGPNNSSPGGSLSIGSGAGGANAAGGPVNITAGNSGGSSGGGGDINLTPGNSAIGAPGSIVMNPALGQTPGIAKINLPLAIPRPNEGTIGTVLNGLVSLSGALAIRTAAGSVSGVIGVCLANCTTGGTAYVAQFGTVPLLLDNTGTPGDYVCISSSSNSNATDCGSSPPTTQQIGRVTSVVSGALYNVLLTVGGGSGGSSGSGAILASPSTGAGSPVAQQLQPSTSGLVGLGVLCGVGAGGTQPCFIVESSTGVSLFKVLNNGTIVFGSGTGGLIQTGGLQVAETTVAFTATPAFNMLQGDVFLITLTGNVTSSTLTNIPAVNLAQRITFIICQDGTGSHTFVWPTVMHGAMTIGPVANACSVQSFVVDSTTARATGTGVVNE